MHVGPGQVLGDVGKGYKVAIETLNEGRIGIAAQMLGLAEGALAHALAYTHERKQFGKPIFTFQAVQMRLAEAPARWRRPAYDLQRGAPQGRRPALHQGSRHGQALRPQVAEWVASECLELFGGYGFTKDYPAEKYFRDSKIGKIYEGTTFMQLQTIAKLL